MVGINLAFWGAAPGHGLVDINVRGASVHCMPHMGPGVLWRSGGPLAWDGACGVGLENAVSFAMVSRDRLMPRWTSTPTKNCI